MNGTGKRLSGKVILSILLLSVGGSLLFNTYMTNKKAEENKSSKGQETSKIVAGETDQIFYGKVERLNKNEKDELHSLFITVDKDAPGTKHATPMFNDGVNIYTEDLKVSGLKSDVNQVKVGDKVELITKEHAPVTMMIPPSIAGDGVIGINIL